MESILLYVCTFFLLICAAACLIRIQNKLKKILVNSAWGVAFACAALGIALMLFYLISGRFEYAYVYNHTDIQLPLLYRISSLWAGQEGSLMLWAFILCAAGFFVLRMRPAQNRVLALYAVVAFCVTLMCALSEPFAKLQGAATGGLGLNSALQDPWMAVHPPLVFIAYSLLAVLFAFCAVPAISREGPWDKRVQNCMLAGFLFLGLGIFTGCIWAYRALGWGGYWAWDPIENSALIPWLVLCAFLHDRRPAGRVRLALPFALACAGTFLARSGILAEASLHAYAQGNIAISVISLTLTVVIILFLLMKRILRKAKEPDAFSLLSIKNPAGFFMVFTYVFAALVFAGTVFPLISGSSLAAGFYNAIAAAYAILCSVQMLAQRRQYFAKHFMVVFVMDTALCAAFEVFFRTGQVLWIIVLWVLLLPFFLCVLQAFREKDKYDTLLHAFAALFFACILTSSALQKESTQWFDAGQASLQMMGLSVSTVDIFSKASVILHGFFYDIVIQTSKCMVANAGIFVVYTVKPLALFFFVSCGVMLLLPFYSLLKPILALKKRHRKSAVNIHG
jgi:cytochrome c-type biogenesis protein CcmF